ncbi:AbgT family transporter [Wenzhouxiangella sp. XN24]|uniref:AbgT family transporter n=1 Tax=Wenzhouxiangella sp. XN24 TaxID=2713569 RepID=UPI0013ED7C62|nr:AbgT family transporter [Wenzhouxiangella sp. XN24]NGX16509.1 AbgT family transporter [Wenzhouxiangella sp. XN24]
MARQEPAAETSSPSPLIARILDWIERVGNKLPDPAVLFLLALIITWVVSALLAPIDFSAIDPRTGDPVVIKNLLSGTEFTSFLSQMVQVFVNFAPLGVVLVAMLGIGVAEHTGFINAGLRALLGFTKRSLLTPMVITVGIVSHTAVDAGYVLVVPLGGVIFYAAGRHPLAGIAAAFAGVSGGFSANFVPSSIDPMLAGITQAGVQVLDTALLINPLNNYFFTASSSLLIILLGWFLTDKIVEPRLKATPLDGDLEDLPSMAALEPAERRALRWSLVSMVLALVVLTLTAIPGGSPWRDPLGELASPTAPLMRSIVPLIFLLFIIPGIVYGYAAGTVKTHRDIIEGMSKAMSGMGYYIVMAFFAAQFIFAFAQSNLGALIAIEGANFLRELGMPAQVTLIGIVFVTGLVNLLVGSASAKWALLAPILVPMLMSLGISPDLTQAAYRVGDSTTNIITPLMPYFPLIVVFCKRYVSNAGIGTLVAMMLPYSVVFLVGWSAFLLLYWAIGLPLGLQSSYVYP